MKRIKTGLLTLSARARSTLPALVVSVLLLAAPVAFADGLTPAPKGKPAPKKEVKKTPAPKKPAPENPAPAPKKPTPKKPVPKKPAPEKKPDKARGKSPVKTSKITIRARDVYLGRYRSFRKPAVLDTQKVFDAISHYRQLKSAGLTKKNGRYWILIQKSNRVFYKALKSIANKHGYDLIGARKSILINGAHPIDVTDALIKIIPSITLD